MGIDYRLIYSDPTPGAALKGDAVELPWAEKVHRFQFNLFGQTAIWQPIKSMTKGTELIIVGQQNRFLVNYFLQIRYLLGGTKVCFWGHGRNFQTTSPNGFLEHWKRFWLTKVHRWFAYTEEAARIVEAAGFPRERITVFNNSIDVKVICDEVASITPDETAAVLKDLGIDSDNIGIFIGGMYKEKRLDFLIESALLIQQQVPNFHLLLIGAGIDAPVAKRAAIMHDFIHYLGPKFGREKSLLATTGKVLLMPGGAGLAVLDSFAYGLPMVTSYLSNHGPEIEYLEHGINGIITPDPENAGQYAEAVAGLLLDKGRRQTLRIAAIRSSQDYSMETMTERFVEGIMAALK